MRAITLNLELVAHTPDVETLVATAMLTTTSGARPSNLYQRLLENPEKVEEVVGRLEVQHGSILEHNRLCWRVEATETEVLETLLRCRFFSFTRLGGSSWIMSANLRTVVEYAQSCEDGFGEALVESIKGIAPTVYGFVRRRRA